MTTHALLNASAAGASLRAVNVGILDRVNLAIARFGRPTSIRPYWGGSMVDTPPALQGWLSIEQKGLEERSVSLEIGKQLGAYKIVGPLGAGGMGEVYRARDTKLGREVALKVLPDVMARDPQRVARFAREAKLLAALNHPNIAGIYDFGEADGTHFLVMELVEGVALNDRFNRGAMSVEEALPIFSQIAEALENAHEQGIVHRDLKPANTKVTDDGRVKVLDFGLAKALESAGADSAFANTLTFDSDPSVVTGEGRVLGTPAYMAPEQASGKPLDKRADIWAFGCCLFEALAGKRPFTGSNATELLADIIKGEPDWDALPKETPGRVRVLLWRCLQKDTRRRLRDIGEAVFEISETSSDPSGSFSALGLTAEAPAEAAGRRRVRTALLTISALVLGCIITSALIWRLTPTVPEPPLRKLMPTLAGLTRPSLSSPVIISPDGGRIVYLRDDRLWVQDLSQLSPRELPGTQSAQKPFWSPDSAAVGYFAAGQLWRVNVSGGSPSTIAALPGQFGLDPFGQGGGAWLADGRIVFSSGIPLAPGLWEVSSRGGDPRLVLETSKGELNFGHPSPLPDGRGVLLVVDSGGRRADTIGVFSRGQRKIVLRLEGENLQSPVYCDSGHIVFYRFTSSPGLWAVPFSLERLEVTDEKPFKIADGYVPSVAADGTLLYLVGGSLLANQKRLVWIDENGNVEPIATREQLIFWRLSLSPGDESRALVGAVDPDAGSIWVHNLLRGDVARVTFPPQGASDALPVWHPDGVHLLFQRNSVDGLKIMMGRVDGAGEPEEIVTGASFSLSTDGKYLVYNFRSEGRQDFDLAYITLDEQIQPHVLRNTPSIERAPSISPDGRLLAYTSNESGDYETYLTRFPSGEGRWSVSLAGATLNFWGKDPTNQLFYYLDSTGEVLYQVTVNFGDEDTEPEIGDPQRLFNLPELGLDRYSRFDPSRDGGRFLAAQKADFGQQADKDDHGQGVVLVQNWASEFREKQDK